MKKFLVMVFAAALMYVPAQSMAQSAAGQAAVNAAGSAQAGVQAALGSIVSSGAAAAAFLSSNSSLEADLINAVEKNSDILVALNNIADQLKDADKLDAKRAQLLTNIVGLMGVAKAAPEMNEDMVNEKQSGNEASDEVKALMAFITNVADNGVIAGNTWNEGSIDQANKIFSAVVDASPNSADSIKTALNSAIAAEKGADAVASILKGMISACGNNGGTSAGANGVE